MSNNETMTRDKHGAESHHKHHHETEIGTRNTRTGSWSTRQGVPRHGDNSDFQLTSNGKKNCMQKADIPTGLASLTVHDDLAREDVAERAQRVVQHLGCAKVS